MLAQRAEEESLKTAMLIAKKTKTMKVYTKCHLNVIHLPAVEIFHSDSAGTSEEKVWKVIRLHLL